MESPGACVTRATSLQARASRDALISMNVLANPVEKERSVKTLKEDIVASVHQVSLGIQMLLVKVKSKPSNALHLGHAQVESCAHKENVFAREDFRGKDLFAGTLMNVHRPLQETLYVVWMLSARIFLEVLTVNVPLDTMEIHF